MPPASDASVEELREKSAAEGLGLSLIIYMAAITAAFLVIATPIYFLLQPTQVANPGLAAYDAPPGTRLFPLVSAKNELRNGAIRLTTIDDSKIVRR